MHPIKRNYLEHGLDMELVSQRDTAVERAL